jgi:ketosteroid isomerase-like protein
MRSLRDTGPAMSEEPTSPDLVERVRGLLEAAGRHEWDAALRYAAPGVVWDSSHRGVGNFEGRSAIQGMWEEWTGAYEDWTIEIVEIVDLGNGVVLAHVAQGGRLIGSSGRVEASGAWIFEWADGMIVRLTAYVDQREGRLAAERLAEERG